MDKKKTKYYIILLVLVLCVSFFLPHMIHAVSDALVSRILRDVDIDEETETDSETETETQQTDSGRTVSVSGEGFGSSSGNGNATAESNEIPQTEETTASSESKTLEQDAEQSERLDAMAAYAEEFNPEITVAEPAEGCYEDFLSGREDKFLKAVADYIYSLYDDMVTIVRIEINEVTQDDDEVCTCTIVLYSEHDNSEVLSCSYNKKWDYYGLYAVSEEE